MKSKDINYIRAFLNQKKEDEEIFSLEFEIQNLTNFLAECKKSELNDRLFDIIYYLEQLDEKLNIY